MEDSSDFLRPDQSNIQQSSLLHDLAVYFIKMTSILLPQCTPKLLDVTSFKQISVWTVSYHPKMLPIKLQVLLKANLDKHPICQMLHSVKTNDQTSDNHCTKRAALSYQKTSKTNKKENKKVCIFDTTVKKGNQFNSVNVS